MDVSYYGQRYSPQHPDIESEIEHNVLTDVLYGIEDGIFALGKDFKQRGDLRRKDEIAELKRELQRMRDAQPMDPEIDRLQEKT